MGINNNNNTNLEVGNMEFLNRICEYEEGEMEWDDVVIFFQDLIDTGFILNLQGHYQRTAQTLIEAGQISFKGNAH
jgi:hypothetical protein